MTEVGEISPPLKTQYGYHILRLEDKKPIDSFEEMEDNIRSRILRDSRSGMIQSQVVAVQKARYAFKEEDATLLKLVNTLNQVSTSEAAAALTGESTADLTLFTVLGKRYLAADLSTYISSQEINRKGTQATFDFWYNRFVAETLSQVEEADLETTNTEYKLLLKEYRDGILLFSLMNEKVWQKGIADSLGQVEYFKKNISRYQWKSRTEAYILKVLDKSELENARRSLQSNGYNDPGIESFEINYRANTPLAFQSEKGVFEYSDHPVLSKVNIELPFQELEVDGAYYLIILGKKFPSEPRKFEESRGLVIRDYQDYLDKTLMDSLKSKYPIQINAQVKENTFLTLNQ